jgi:hypothetical protein
MSDAEGTAAPRWVEIAELTVLALVAIATAWSGYQATTWGGRQSELYGLASTARFQADASATLGAQELAFDASVFTAWLQARSAGDRALQRELERRFTPDYATAFEDWLATDPFGRGDAPVGPAAMPNYENPGLAQAEQLNAQASANFAAGTDARQTANTYARDTVLLATVIFFVVTAQRFTRRGIRLGANAIALGLLVYTLSTLATLPRA